VRSRYAHDRERPPSCDLADSMAAAIEAHPKSHAVLVRRHGVYVWGEDWVQAKTHAECYDYLFEAAVQMRKLGFDPKEGPRAPELEGKPHLTH